VVAQDTITELVERIVQWFHPQRVILFGSYAYGVPNDASDVDLLVIMPFEGKAARKAVEILNRIDARIPLDMVVRTPEEMTRRLALNDFFLQEIVRKGKVLYDSADS
jgi:uncharacterized protein